MTKVVLDKRFHKLMRSAHLVYTARDKEIKIAVIVKVCVKLRPETEEVRKGCRVKCLETH